MKQEKEEDEWGPRRPIERDYPSEVRRRSLRLTVEERCRSHLPFR